MEYEGITAFARVAQVLVGIGGLILVGRGLQQMGWASEERSRQLDIMEANQRQQGDALRQQGEVLAELLRRTHPS